MTEIERCVHGRLMTHRCWRCMVATVEVFTDGKSVNEHGTVPASLFARGVWPKCQCGFDPHDNLKLIAHYAEHGFREIDDHGQILRFPIEKTARSQ